MTFFIRTPAGTDRYSLTSDLTILASDVSSHLDNLQTNINLAVKENSSPTFTSIMTNSPPIFPGITLTGPRSNSSVINNGDGFGFKSNALKFVTTDSSAWTSNGPINVPDSGTGTQAVNGNTLNSAVTTLTNRIAALEATVAALTSNVYSKAASDAAHLDLSNRITAAQTKANLVDQMTYHVEGNNTKAYLANYADNAGYAGSAGSAGTASSASMHAGVYWNMGVQYIGTVPASGGNMSNVPTYETYIPHGLGRVLRAAVVTPVGDDGQQSVVASITGWDENYIWVKFRNLNVGEGEDCSVSWVAMANG